MKWYNKIKGIFKRYSRHIRLLFWGGLILSVPVIFAGLFVGKESSSFLFVDTNISVSDWFSFWISYLSFVATFFLAVAAYDLSKSMQRNEIRQKMKENKVAFVLEDILVRANNEDEIQFDLHHPAQILAIDSMKIEEAEIVVKSKYTIKLKVEQPAVKGSVVTTLSVEDSYLEKAKEQLNHWYRYRSLASLGYEVAELRIKYCYTIESPFKLLRFRKSEDKVLVWGNYKIKMTSDPGRLGRVDFLKSIVTATDEL